MVQTPVSSRGRLNWNRPAKPRLRAKATAPSISTGPVIACCPAKDPEAGIGVCSSVHGTSFAAPWFIAAWVLSDSGASHFSAGNVFHACTNLPPQIPAQLSPEIRNTSNTAEVQIPTTPCSDFHSARPRTVTCGTTKAAGPPLRGQCRYTPLTTNSTARLAAASIR